MFRYLWLLMLAGCAGYEWDANAPVPQRTQVDPSAYRMPETQRTTTTCTRAGRDTVNCESTTTR